MTDRETVEFLKWALPRLGLRWAGFRKVRGQVEKRLRRRIGELGLPGLDAYRDRFESDPEEQRVLDTLCRIPISRFYRDRGVFAWLEENLPQGAHLRVWCAGCASGEEPYSLSLLNHFARPDLRLRILATDADPLLLERARATRYGESSLKELPPSWRAQAFDRVKGELVLRDEYREGIEWRQEDIRETMPEGPFDLVFCRNLAFTYFEKEIQDRILGVILRQLFPGGLLVIGRHDRLPRWVGHELAPCIIQFGTRATGSLRAGGSPADP